MTNDTSKKNKNKKWWQHFCSISPKCRLLRNYYNHF